MQLYSPIKLIRCNLKISLAVLLTASFAIAACSYTQQAQASINNTEKVRPVKLLQVDNTSTQSHKVFPAKVAADQQVDLAFRINGQLTQLNLLAGQKVKKGELLAQLDNRDAKNALLNAQANHQLATVDFARKKKLLAKKQISTAEFDSAQAQLQSTLATLNAAQDQLSYTSLTAPFSGVIAKVDLDNHQMLQASQVVMTLQGNKQFDITFNVPESYLFDMASPAQQNNQQKYSVKLNGRDHYFPATFKEMNRVINSGSQTYQMTLSFTPPAALSILPGMSAQVIINETANNLPVTILPLSAIVHDEQTEQDFVWVYQAQTQRLKKAIVELGKIRTQGTEIVSGLKEGDQVVAVGANAINSESKVSPLHWERGI